MKYLLLSLILTCVFLASPNVNARIWRVSAPKEIESAVGKAMPGDIISVADGRYDDPLKLKGNGTDQSPITIRPEKDGSAILNGHVSLRGNHVIVEGFHFGPESRFDFIEGKGHSLRNCRFDGLKAGHWVRFKVAAQHCEVAYCSFTNDDNSKESGNQQLIQIKRRDERGPDYHHIHHNYFADITPGLDGNGFETIQVHQGQEGGRGASHTTIEYNFFERCNGERETISVKCSENQIRYNVFVESQGALVFRAGHKNTAEGNVFIGNSVPDTEGIRIQGRNHRLINNYMQDLVGPALSLHDGDPSDFYERVEDAVIAFNTIVDCEQPLVIGLTHSNVESVEPPLRVLLVNNIFVNTEGPVFLYPDNDPEDWTLAGNIYLANSLGVPDPGGFTETDPGLKMLDIGIQAPANNSPLIGKAVQGYVEIENDLFKNSRAQDKQTTGAIEITAGKIPSPPVTREEVGPQFPSK